MRIILQAPPYFERIVPKILHLLKNITMKTVEIKEAAVKIPN